MIMMMFYPFLESRSTIPKYKLSEPSSNHQNELIVLPNVRNECFFYSVFSIFSFKFIHISTVSTQNQPSLNIINQQQRQMISGRRNESNPQQSQSICMVVPHNNPNNNLADTIPVTLTTGSGAIRPLCVITDSTPEQISASGMNFSNVTTASKKIFF